MPAKEKDPYKKLWIPLMEFRIEYRIFTKLIFRESCQVPRMI